MLATLPGRTHGLGLITEPLLKDLQLEKTAYAQLNLLATLLGSLFCLPMGRLLDRVGSRWTSTVVLASLGGVVLAMSRVQSVNQLFWCVLLTRAIGQSALSVVSISMVGKWFARKGGPAMGLYSVLMSLMFATAFAVVGGWVKFDGWRLAWEKIGWSLLGLSPVFWIFVRDRPEVCGLTVDHASTTESTEVGFQFWDATRTHAFWLFAIATSLFGLAVAGIGLFNQSILEEFGFGFDDYRAMLVLSTAAGLVGQFSCGLAIYRWSIKTVLGAAMLVYAVALTCLPFVKSINDLRGCTFLLGGSGGAITVVFFACWGKTFGRGQLGRIQGAAQMLTVLASAVGPLLFAEVRGRCGSYVPVLWTLAFAAAACGIAAWIVRMPVQTLAAPANPDGEQPIR